MTNKSFNSSIDLMNYVYHRAYKLSKVLNCKEIPIYCVIAKFDKRSNSYKVIVESSNKIETDNCSIKHAEIVCILEIFKLKSIRFLDEYDIFVSLEPCMMCASTISYARLKSIHFYEFNNEGGFYSSKNPLFLTQKHLFRPKIIIHKVQKSKSYKCQNIIKIFFKKIRG
ncbi:MAG: nucleoside deaminase [Alphaproteobacteria bacterium]|nr:nucleoside deaminase [Alphaproteobacteria bacterium]MBL0717713.1 nucleoside deaminase [Alphaproteobacteria bacterium]